MKSAKPIVAPADEILSLEMRQAELRVELERANARLLRSRDVDAFGAAKSRIDQELAAVDLLLTDARRKRDAETAEQALRVRREAAQARAVEVRRLVDIVTEAGYEFDAAVKRACVALDMIEDAQSALLKFGCDCKSVQVRTGDLHRAVSFDGLGRRLGLGNSAAANRPLIAILQGRLGALVTTAEADVEALQPAWPDVGGLGVPQ